MDGSQGEHRRGPAGAWPPCGASCRTIRNSCTGDDGLLDELGLKVAPAAMWWTSARRHGPRRTPPTSAKPAQRQQLEETARGQLRRPGPDPRRGRRPAGRPQPRRPRPPASTSWRSSASAWPPASSRWRARAARPPAGGAAGRGPGRHDPGRPQRLARMGVAAHRARPVRRARRGDRSRWPWSAWRSGSPSRQGLLAFGSADPDGFTEDMGAELVAFLARVVERTAERWPVL